MFCPVCSHTITAGQSCKRCGFKNPIVISDDPATLGKIQEEIEQWKKRWLGRIREMGICVFDYSGKEEKKIRLPIITQQKGLNYNLHWADKELYQPTREQYDITYYLIEENNTSREATYRIKSPGAGSVIPGIRLLEEGGVELVLARPEDKKANMTDKFSKTRLAEI